MKVAHLPNGKKLQFPDLTDDEAIDKTVEAHLKDNERREKEENENRERDDKKRYREEDVGHRKARYDQSDSHHSQMIAMHMHGHQLMNDVKDSVKDLTKALEKLSDNAKALGKLAPAVTDLGKNIDGAVDEIVKALSAPKNLVFDSRGRAVGVKKG